MIYIIILVFLASVFLAYLLNALVLSVIFSLIRFVYIMAEVVARFAKKWYNNVNFNL